MVISFEGEMNAAPTFDRPPPDGGATRRTSIVVSPIWPYSPSRRTSIRSPTANGRSVPNEMPPTLRSMVSVEIGVFFSIERDFVDVPADADLDVHAGAAAAVGVLVGAIDQADAGAGRHRGRRRACSAITSVRAVSQS